MRASVTCMFIIPSCVSGHEALQMSRAHLVRLISQLPSKPVGRTALPGADVDNRREASRQYGGQLGRTLAQDFAQDVVTRLADAIERCGLLRPAIGLATA